MTMTKMYTYDNLKKTHHYLNEFNQLTYASLIISETKGDHYTMCT